MTSSASFSAICLAAILAVLSISTVSISAAPAPLLTVYTYKGFMSTDGDGSVANPYYDFATLFGIYASVPASSIKIVYVKSTCLLSSLCAGGCYANTPFASGLVPGTTTVTRPTCVGSDTNTNPPADVIMGIDLQQEQLATPADPQLLTFSTNATLLPAVASLGHFDHMKAVDYGLVGITYDKTVIPSLIGNAGSTFTFESLFTLGLINRLVVMDPSLDTSGLNFFLWTIAHYGDASIGLAGVGLDPALGDYRQFWKRAFASKMSVASSWGDAFNLFVSPTSDVALMGSYGTDPAYAYCDNTTPVTNIVTLTTHSAPGFGTGVGGNTPVTYGWAQVEGIAINSASLNVSLAKQFVEFMSSPTMQGQLYTNQYMLPVTTTAPAAPSCYGKSAFIPPSSVTLLNSRLPSVMVTAKLSQWIEIWLNMYAASVNNKAQAVSQAAAATAAAAAAASAKLNAATTTTSSTSSIMVAMISVIVAIVLCL